MIGNDSELNMKHLAAEKLIIYRDKIRQNIYKYSAWFSYCARRPHKKAIIL